MSLSRAHAASRQSQSDLDDLDESKGEGLRQAAGYGSGLVIAWNNLHGMLCVPGDGAEPEVVAVCQTLWRLISSRAVTLCMMDDSRVISTSLRQAVHRSGRVEAAILLPFNWPSLLREDAFMQLGAIVAVASRCADLWCGQLSQLASEDATPSARLAERHFAAMQAQDANALRREALFLHQLASEEPGDAHGGAPGAAHIAPPWKPNAYQKSLLRLHPSPVRGQMPDLPPWSLARAASLFVGDHRGLRECTEPPASGAELDALLAASEATARP